MNKNKFVLALILVALATIVVFQNQEPVQTRILFFTLSASRAVLLGSTLLVGLAAGFLLGWRSRRSD